MSDRLHEIMAQIGVIHEQILNENKINDIDLIFEHIEDYDSDVKEYYLNMLLQYYFQNNDLNNVQEMLLVGAKFDMTFSDVKDAFLNIKSSDENVIEFMEESVIFLRDNDIESNLAIMHEYYMKNRDIQVCLEQAVELIKKNRYVCAYCYKHSKMSYSEFFLNEDLLESLKKDLPYLLK